MSGEDKQQGNAEDVRVDVPEVSQHMSDDMVSADATATETHSENNAEPRPAEAVDAVAEPADAGEPTLESISTDDLNADDQNEGGIDYKAAVREMTRTIESLQAQVEERTGQYMRIAADFDNFRKRTQKEKEELEQQIKCNTVVELLPVVDNFERARSQIKPQTDPEMNIHKSYQGVYKDFVERLKRIGVSPMRAEGSEFDPNLHEAVMREQTNKYPEGTVTEELVRGYMLGDRVLRHAMVKVAAQMDEDSASSSDGADPAISE